LCLPADFEEGSSAHQLLAQNPQVLGHPEGNVLTLELCARATIDAHHARHKYAFPLLPGLEIVRHHVVHPE